MLRFRPPFASASAAPGHRRPSLVHEPLLYTPAPSPSGTDDAGVHVDYDRHPLGVHEYEHYVAPSERDERFHVR